MRIYYVAIEDPKFKGMETYNKYSLVLSPTLEEHLTEITKLITANQPDDAMGIIGRSVAVLEKEVAGYGASTRNGGMIGSGHRVAFTDVARQYGEDVAEAVLGEGKLALDYTTGLIADQAIDCDFVRCGRFRGAWRPGT